MGEAARPSVGVVLSGYGVVARGAETMLEELLPRLEPRFDLTVYSRSGAGPGGLRRRAIPRQAIEPLYLSRRWVRKALDTLRLDPLHVEWTSHLLASLPALARRRHDVVWHETGLWGGRLLAGLRRWTGVRLLDVGHSNHPGWEVPFARRRPDAYVAFNEAFAEMIRSRVPRLRVVVIPLGIDCERFRPGAEPLPLAVRRPVVLVVGALSPEKRTDLVIEAAARAGASVVLAGAGPLAAALDRLAQERLGEGRYQRLALERSRMPRLYAAADVVALGSPVESGPLSFLEALACGRPVVGAADAARSELIGDAGVLVARQEPDAYARALSTALERDWGELPRRRALGFSLDESARRFGDLLEELAEERS